MNGHEFNTLKVGDEVIIFVGNVTKRCTVIEKKRGSRLLLEYTKLDGTKRREVRILNTVLLPKDV